MLIRNLQDALERRAEFDAVVKESGNVYTAGVLRADVFRLRDEMQRQLPAVEECIVGLAMKSSYQWLVAMLATHLAGATLLPVPIEFADDQIGSLLGKADVVFVNSERLAARIGRIIPAHAVLDLNALPTEWPFSDTPQRAPEIRRALSIIHTSGTTSAPKGVILSEEGIDELLASLRSRVPHGPLEYTSVVPMSLLIEQVTGVYLPLLSGGCITFLPDELPEFGAGIGEINAYVDHLNSTQPSFGYLPPAIVSAIDSAPPGRVAALRGMHVITGGASIQAKILESLLAKGFSIFEAYGMSENSSMISLNFTRANRIGTAGKLLPHLEGRIENGELEIRSKSLCLGYYNAPGEEVSTEDGWFRTGDLCELDADGYLKIVGRRKHLIILSNARNVSAEWVENTYKASPMIDDIIVMGEGKSTLGAVILSSNDSAAVNDELTRMHEKLAHYAQVRSIVVPEDADKFRSDYFTVTGRPRRQQIFEDFSHMLWEEAI